MRQDYKKSKRGHQEIQARTYTRNDHGFKEPEESQKNAEGQDRLITLLDKQGREMHDQDTFYTAL